MSLTARSKDSPGQVRTGEEWHRLGEPEAQPTPTRHRDTAESRRRRKEYRRRKHIALRLQEASLSAATGDCPICGCPLSPGDTVQKDRETGSVVHRHCVELRREQRYRDRVLRARGLSGWISQKRLTRP